MACLHHRCFLYLQLQQDFHYFLPSIPNDAEHTHSPKTGKKQSNCDPTSTWTAVLIRILFLLLKCIQDDYLTNCARMHIKCFCHPTKFTLILRTIMCANFYSQHLLVFPYPKILCPLSPQHVLWVTCIYSLWTESSSVTQSLHCTFSKNWHHHYQLLNGSHETHVEITLLHPEHPWGTKLSNSTSIAKLFNLASMLSLELAGDLKEKKDPPEIFLSASGLKHSLPDFWNTDKHCTFLQCSATWYYLCVCVLVSSFLFLLFFFFKVFFY